MFAQRTNWNLATNRLSKALAAHRAAGKPLIDLTVSNPTECGFQYKEQKILDALRNPAALRYDPNPRGLAVAREAVRSYYASKTAANLSSRRENAGKENAPQGESISLDDIFLTTSTSEAYSYAFRTLCNPSDEILIPEPSYPLFEFLADIQDVSLTRYSLVYDHGWQIDFRSLEQAITPRTRGVIVVHPNNPTGNYCRAREMQQLNELCSSRHLAIIADEVFLDFSLNSKPSQHERPSSFAQFASGKENCGESSEALTFALSGISKICGLPQMKAAWIVLNGPETLKNQAAARLEVIADSYLSMNAPVQHALPILLDLRGEFQQQLLARVHQNLAELDHQLAAHSTTRRLEVEGGWNAVLRVPAMGSDEDLALRLLEEKGVYAHPGHFYDFPSDGYLVVSLITPPPEFASGIERLLTLF